MLLLIIACQAAPTRLVQPEGAEWTESDIWEAYDTVLVQGLPNVSEAFSLFQDLYDEGATLECPGSNYNFDSPDAQDNGCVSTTDFAYNGASEVLYEDRGWNFACDCRIDAPDGRRFEGAGNIVKYSEETDGFVQEFLDIRGTFQTNFGPEWLQARPSSVLSINIGELIQISGGYTYENTSLYFNEIGFDFCDFGFGRLDVRDPSGGWWYFERSDACDDTGTLYFNNTVVNQNAKKDLRPLLDAMIDAMVDVSP